MKAWPDDHPKARLMACKRAAILGAAKEAFLRVGYEGASMEAIAAAAGISIMTLYRHARSKDELFGAVILNACDCTHDALDPSNAALMQCPLRDLLALVGDLFQQKITKAETVALFRAVMVETVRFPHLAEAAYRSFVEEWEIVLDGFLAHRAEFRDIEAPARRRLVTSFIDYLVGLDALRVLFGLAPSSVSEHKRRSIEAAERFLTAMPQTIARE